MSDNPFETPLHKSNLPKKSWLRFPTFLEVVVIAVVCLILLALLMPATRRARPAAHRAGCINNMRQIQLAILNYESANGVLPPAYTVDENGSRLHSWRTLILPYLDENELYKMIDLSKPWDDPVNAAARNAPSHFYLCPSSSNGQDPTSYMAIVGPNHVFSGPDSNELEKFADASDWMTIMEVPAEEQFHWMSPYDADEQMLQRISGDSDFNHGRTFILAFLDGHTISFPVDQLDFFRRSVPKLANEDVDRL